MIPKLPLEFSMSMWIQLCWKRQSVYLLAIQTRAFQQCAEALNAKWGCLDVAKEQGAWACNPSLESRMASRMATVHGSEGGKAFECFGTTRRSDSGLWGIPLLLCQNICTSGVVTRWKILWQKHILFGSHVGSRTAMVHRLQRWDSFWLFRGEKVLIFCFITWLGRWWIAWHWQMFLRIKHRISYGNVIWLHNLQTVWMFEVIRSVFIVAHLSFRFQREKKQYLKNILKKQRIPKIYSTGFWKQKNGRAESMNQEAASGTQSEPLAFTPTNLKTRGLMVQLSIVKVDTSGVNFLSCLTKIRLTGVLTVQR